MELFEASDTTIRMWASQRTAKTANMKIAWVPHVFVWHFSFCTSCIFFSLYNLACFSSIYDELDGVGAALLHYRFHSINNMCSVCLAWIVSYMSSFISEAKKIVSYIIRKLIIEGSFNNGWNMDTSLDSETYEYRTRRA